MSIRQIITNPERLSEMCFPLDEWDTPLTQDLMDTAHKLRLSPLGCLGLAAPQIGYLFRAFVMWQDDRFNIMFNPEIIKRSGEKTHKFESCLSVPGKSIRVSRNKRIRVRYIERSGEEIERNFTNMNARVFQHELDHLNGVII